MEVDIEVMDGTLHVPEAEPPSAESVPGPGWFESSRALKLGLSIVEWEFGGPGATACEDERC